MRSIWFTSDTHFDHANVIRWNKRPQYQESDEVIIDGERRWVSDAIAESRVKQMNEELLSNFNEVVKPGDEVWHLGDFCLSKKNTRKRTEYFVNRMNGQINWIFGNHDHRQARAADGFNYKGHYRELRKVQPDNTMFVLMHYAMRIWNKRHHGAIHLYGHSHGNLPDCPNSLSMDVGVDCQHYYPIHVDDVIHTMKQKKAELELLGINWRGEDHHSMLEGRSV